VQYAILFRVETRVEKNGHGPTADKVISVPYT